MITLDTSGLIALLNARDVDHAAVVGILDGEGGPWLVPAGILAEVTYMVETRLGANVLDLFIGGVVDGAFQVDCGDQDLARIRALVKRYADLPLGFAHAALIACAERSGGRVLTLDRDFAVVSREVPLTITP